MAQYRIICTEQAPVRQPTSHAHIVTVGIGGGAHRIDGRLSLSQVLAAIDQGVEFWTYGEVTKKWARVEKATCDCCGHIIIRSASDAVGDNNLSTLRLCNWS